MVVMPFSVIIQTAECAQFLKNPQKFPQQKKENSKQLLLFAKWLSFLETKNANLRQFVQFETLTRLMRR